MQYWPTMTILQGLLRPEQRCELMSLQISENTMGACYNLACKLPACKSLVVICSEGAEMRRVYLERPTAENWIALERGGFMTAFDNFGFIMDALH